MSNITCSAEMLSQWCCQPEGAGYAGMRSYPLRAVTGGTRIFHRGRKRCVVASKNYRITAEPEFVALLLIGRLA